MIYWIFDLDNTLYHIPQHINFNYNLIQKNYNLFDLLSKIKDKKIIFTNGTKSHAIHTLDLINIHSCFDINDIYGRYETGFKPSLKSYNEIIRVNNIKDTDKIIFFEDTIENLIVAKKKYNWITVDITGKYYNNESVDFSFNNIEQSLQFFINCLNII